MPNPIITAALTGPVATKADNPGMPGTVAEIAADARAAYDAGAAVIHIHLRDDDGNMTVDLDVARRTVEAVRATCPGIVQLSTGGLAFTYEDRMKMVEAKPAMATLNPCTMTFGAEEFRNPPKPMMQLAARMIELGVKPEVEIYDSGHLEMMLYLVHKGLLLAPLQVSFVMGVRGGMKGDPALLAYLVRELPEGTSWQVIGVAGANLPMTTIGLAMGGNARTGMEDTLTLEKGVPAASNAQLVERLVRIARSLQREPATVAEVVERLKLSPELVGSA
ncbi:MAG: 3-keto-5-aminohexanoate cleavage protein [Actinomycetes bacterium]